MTAWFILKLFHVFAGAFWFGAAILLIYFIAPAVKATAPAGPQFMGHLAGKLKLPNYVGYAAWITTITGILLFARLSEAFKGGYLETVPGIALLIGGGTGVLTFIGAVFVQLPRSRRISALGAEAGANPTPELLAEIKDEQRKFALGGHIVIVLFVVTLICMLMSHPI